MGNDEKFRTLLRGLNKTFYHKTVTTKEIETYIAKRSGLKLDKIFDQYLRHTEIPVLEYKISNNQLNYRWAKTVKGFSMPVKVTLKKDIYNWITPAAAWKTIAINKELNNENFRADPSFYILTRRVSK